MLAELGGHESLESTPGTTFSYRNPGYTCLSVIVERIAGEPFPDFARSRLFEPLGMAATRYWPGPDPFPPGTTPTERGSPAPLSLGDCGVWSTAADLMRWNEAMANDELGVSGLLHTAGRLDDGTPIPYGWGVDVLTLAGYPLHRHGGLGAGLSAQVARLPAAACRYGRDRAGSYGGSHPKAGRQPDRRAGRPLRNSARGRRQMSWFWRSFIRLVHSARPVTGEQEKIARWAVCWSATMRLWTTEALSV